MNTNNDYQRRLSNEECISVQLDPRMHEVYRNKDLKKSEKLFHLNKLWEKLKANHPIPYPVGLTLHNSNSLPVRVYGDRNGTGIIHATEDSHADIHVAYKKRSLFRSLITLAHEYHHGQQLLIDKRFDDGLALEAGATDFSYDFVTDYCKEVFLNEQPN